MSIQEPRHRIERNELLRTVDLESLLDALSGPAQHRRWRCPEWDHPDEHPSVTVTTGSDRIQRWRCWSGGHHGTAIDAVMAAHHVTAGDAIRWLADRHGHWPTIDRPPPPPAREIGEPSPDVIEFVQRAEKLLWTAAGRPQREWLHARGLGDEVLKANRVGADPGRRYLPRPRGFPGRWPAVVYPALSPGGAITYFQARYLEPPEGRGKYDNPSRTHAGNPRIACLRAAGDQHTGLLVVTEGIADGLVAAQAGFSTVGVLGSSMGDDYTASAIANLAGDARSSSQVAICFDADDAGREGSNRLKQRLSEAGITADTVRLRAGADLTDWALSDRNWAQRLVADRLVGPTIPLRISVAPL